MPLASHYHMFFQAWDRNGLLLALHSGVGLFECRREETQDAAAVAAAAADVTAAAAAAAAALSTRHHLLLSRAVLSAERHLLTRVVVRFRPFALRRRGAERSSRSWKDFMVGFTQDTRSWSFKRDFANQWRDDVCPLSHDRKYILNAKKKRNCAKSLMWNHFWVF